MTPTMLVFVCIGWFCLVATVSCQIMPISAMANFKDQHLGLPVQGKSNIFSLPSIANRSPCRDGMCGGVSYNEILQQYKGFFLSIISLYSSIHLYLFINIIFFISVILLWFIENLDISYRFIFYRSRTKLYTASTRKTNSNVDL